MKAVVFEAPGPPADVCVVRDVDPPEPAAGDVLIKVDARAIQPADFMFVEGRYRPTPACPEIAGLEGTGTIAAAGSTTSFVVGSRVAFRHPGTWAEFVAVPEAKLYPVPDGVAMSSAAQFALNPITAWALIDELGARVGDWIAVNAATSSVAQMMHGLARRRGAHVVGIVRRRPVAMLPFPFVVDSSAVADAVLHITSGESVAGLLDCVGGRAITDMAPALRQGATIVSFAVLTPDAAAMTNAEMVYRNLNWKGFGIDFLLARHPARRNAMVDA